MKHLKLILLIIFLPYQASAYAASNDSQDLNTYQINMQNRIKAMEARLDSDTFAGQAEKLCFVRNEMLKLLNFAKERSQFNTEVRQNELVKIRTQLNQINKILKYKDGSICELLK